MHEVSSPKKPSSLWESMRQFRIIRPEDGYSQEVLLLLTLIVSAYVVASLISFSPFDPSNYNYSFPPRTPQNLGGILGSNLAASLIYQFGGLAYLLPLPWVWMAMAGALGQVGAFDRSRLIGWVILLLSLLLAAHAWFPILSIEGLKYPPGGALGFYTHHLVQQILGRAGCLILILAGAWLGLLMVRRKPFLKPFYLKQKTRWLASRQQKVATNSLAPVKPRGFWRKNNSAVPSPIVSSEPEFEIFNGGPQEPSLGDENANQKLAQKIAIYPQLPDLSDTLLQHSASVSSAAAPQIKYQAPPATLFKTSPFTAAVSDEQKREFEQTAEALVKAFSEFGIGGEIIAIQPGPVVTVYEFQPLAGTKLAKVTGLLDDIALALRVDSILIHPVSGKRALGVQVPNKKRETVFLGDLLQHSVFQQARSPLTFALGKALNGEPICCDLAAMPHLLTAGQTGSGKSVAINALICSLILKASPEQVRMILVDPKILELKVYEGIPHLLMPVITEPLKASLALKWACQEMDRRYQLMETAMVRHISGFNQYWEQAPEAQKQAIRDRFPDTDIGKLPFIVIVIDELADLMLTASKDVENSIQRLAQKARASGIHLVLATQRPSVDVITGVIKANLPCRIAFKVFSRIDSRTILDSMGAERLLGKGDMLFLRPGSSKLERIQGAFLSDEEVITMVEHLKKSRTADYDKSAMEWIDEEFQRQDNGGEGGPETSGHTDKKWSEALGIAQRQGFISASYLQRMMKIGYNRAARIVEAMEAQGLVGKAEGSKPRAWLGQ